VRVLDAEGATKVAQRHGGLAAALPLVNGALACFYVLSVLSSLKRFEATQVRQ
jgi:hypothetical protein